MQQATRTVTSPTSRACRRSARTRDLRFSVRIKAKPEVVYRALTSATELCRWWLAGAETDARNTGRFRMVWPKVRRPHLRNGYRQFPAYVAVGDSEGQFVDLQPGRKVAWMWKLPKKGLFPPLSSFFIAPVERGCEVTLVHTGFSTAVAADKIFSGCAEGWEDCLSKLKLYLENGRSCKTQILTFAALKGLKKERR